MKNRAKSKLLVWQIALALGLLVVLLAAHQPATAVPNAPDANPTWGTATQISGAGQDGQRPRIAASPDGSRLLVVYINEADDDPYYTMSSNQGQTWSPAAGTKLQATPGTSAQVIGVIDQTNKAYAFWVEKNTALGNELVYSSKTDSGSWTVPVRITNSAEILDPNVFLDANNKIHLVWVQQEVVHYAYLASGASSWSTPVIVEEEPLGFSSEPTGVVDWNGRLYLTWANDSSVGGEQEVVFSQGTISGTSAAPQWNPEVQNTLLSSPIDTPIAAHPVMGLSGSKLHIAYTRKLVSSGANDQQDIYYAACSLPCDTLNSTAFVAISGLFVEVNGNDPSEVVAALALDQVRNAAYITFSGIVPTTLNPNEVIQGIQSCDNWANGSVLPYTIEDNDDYRFIKPAMVASQGWIQLVYDRISSGSIHQIFHRRAAVTCKATLFLPVLRK